MYAGALVTGRARIAAYYHLHPGQVGPEPPRVRLSDGEAERGP